MVINYSSNIFQTFIWYFFFNIFSFLLHFLYTPLWFFAVGLVLILPCWMWSCLLSQSGQSKILLCLPILSCVSIHFRVEVNNSICNLIFLNSCTLNKPECKYIPVNGRNKSLEMVF